MFRLGSSCFSSFATTQHGAENRRNDHDDSQEDAHADCESFGVFLFLLTFVLIRRDRIIDDDVTFGLIAIHILESGGNAGQRDVGGADALILGDGELVFQRTRGFFIGDVVDDLAHSETPLLILFMFGLDC